MIAFIDAHRAVHGGEPICKVLPIAPSTYYAHTARKADPSKVPARSRSDAELSVAIRRIWNENFQVYGVRKVWRQLRCEGLDVARCTVARLMRLMGLKGATRGKAVRTTISDRAGGRLVSAGLPGVPKWLFSPTTEYAKGVMLVRPTSTAPACFRRATTGASCRAGGCRRAGLPPLASLPLARRTDP